MQDLQIMTFVVSKALGNSTEQQAPTLNAEEAQSQLNKIFGR